jgi:hypothetical protein
LHDAHFALHAQDHTENIFLRALLKWPESPESIGRTAK